MKKIFITLLGLYLTSCGNDPLPKPKGLLRLEYREAVYKTTKTSLPFSFDKNKNEAIIINAKPTPNSSGINISYPKLKATIYLTYKSVTKSNLDSLLRDTQNLTQKHTIKADEISQNEFENPESKVYGMLYEVGGNAASQAQFYLTDSTTHFLSGSLYFYTKPNYDSIYPASEYLKKDIKRFMESIRWKD